MKKILRILFVALFILHSLNGYSDGDENKRKSFKRSAVSLIPDFLKLQYAGNIGLGSIGIGHYWWKEHMQTEIFYGYVPSRVGGNTIRTVAVKNTVNLFSYHLGDKIFIKQQVGFSTNLAFTKRTYFKLPDYYPNNYYSPNAIHALPFLSQECILPLKSYCVVKKIGFYTELSAVDTYLYQSSKSKQVRFIDAWSLAIGIAISF